MKPIGGAAASGLDPHIPSFHPVFSLSDHIAESGDGERLRFAAGGGTRNP
jgi:hypothetical protein